MNRKIQILFESNFEVEHKNDKGIYSIYFINSDKFYIGSTSSQEGFTGRWRQHIQGLRNNKHSNTILQRTYNKYGENLLRFKIVEICNYSNEEILNREQQYIDFLKPSLNINTVATGCIFPENWISPKSIPVLQYDLDGNFIKEYTSISKANNTINGDVRQALQNLNKYSTTQAGGFQWRLKTSENFNLKISSYKYSQEKIILCYDSNGNFYKEYPSMVKASEDTGVDVGNISKTVSGLMRSCSGYFFKEKHSNSYPLHIDDILRLHKNQISVEIEDLDTGEKYHFSSLRQIPKQLISRGSLHPYLKQNLKEFVFKKRDSKKQYKVKIKNYNKV